MYIPVYKIYILNLDYKCQRKYNIIILNTEGLHIEQTKNERVVKCIKKP